MRLATLSLLALTLAAAAQPKHRILESIPKLPLSFEANQGQSDPKVRFLARGPGYSLFLTSTEAVLSLRRAAQSDVVRMKLVEANPTARISGLDELPGRSNYLIGNDPARWRTDVRRYSRVKYEQIYPGVDLVYYGNPALAGQLEYDFVVAPGGDPQAIQFAVEGAKKMRVDKRGDLVLTAAGGELRLHKPVVYQEIAGARLEIAGGYTVGRKRRVRFQVAAYDRSRPLIIDPSVGFTVSLAGSGSSNGVFGVAVDPVGNSYLTGFTTSTDFPMAGAIQGKFGGGSGEAFVTKLAADGAVLYSTFLGGSGSDIGQSIAVDSSGNTYIAGSTSSRNFPVTSGAFQETYGGGDADVFVTVLDPTGRAFVYSTYLGGNQLDNAGAIAVGSDGSAYVVGSGYSSNFPTTAGALRTTPPNSIFTGFVSKIKPDGSALAYSTYLGGSSFDQAIGVAVDSAGNAYVTGTTSSSNFPTTAGAYQTTAGGSVGFVTKLNPAGSSAVYSTFFGSSFTQATAIAVDSAGNAYVTGFTTSKTFPTTASAYQKTLKGNSDAFVTKLNPGGTALTFSTYLGGSGDDNGVAIALGGPDSSAPPPVLIAGTTNGQADYPTLNPVQACTPGSCPGAIPSGLCHSGIVTELQGDGSGLLFSTCLGSGGDYQLNGIGLSAQGSVLVAGRTTPNSAVNPASDQPHPFVRLPTAAANEQGSVTKIDKVPVSCFYFLDPKSRIHGIGILSDVTTYPVNVTAPDGCSWRAVSNASWIHMVLLSGTGPGIFTYFLDANPGPGSRIGTVTVTGTNPVQDKTFTVTQTFCRYDWIPSAVLFGAQAQLDRKIAVTTSPGCEWDLSSPNWVATIPPSGSGSKTITLSANENRTNDRRIDNVIVTGSSVKVTQSAPPKINSITPTTGTAGAKVTITGSGLSGSSSSSSPQSLRPGPAMGADALVSFNGVIAAVLSNTGTQIQTVVPAGATSGPITVTTALGDIATSPTSFTVTPGTPAGLPVINAGGTVNGASFAKQVAPGSIASVFGSGLATKLDAATGLPLPSILGGGQLQFNDPIAVPTFFASPNQSNFQVPWELAGQTQAYLWVLVNGVPANPVLVPLASFAPGIFTTTQTGQGQGAVQIANTAIFAAPAGSIPGVEARPAQKGDFLTIFCTGLGDVSNRPASGAAASGTTLSTTLTTPTVTIGGVAATVAFSGLSPGFVGLYQVNVQVPTGAPSGNAVPLVISIGGATSNTVTIAVQ